VTTSLRSKVAQAYPPYLGDDLGAAFPWVGTEKTCPERVSDLVLLLASASGKPRRDPSQTPWVCKKGSCRNPLHQDSPESLIPMETHK
jgi:hypothetical protein